MARRSYNLGRRAEAAEETRARILEATVALHGERGISATPLKDVAERAGVSVGTVYHHFPTTDDLITACGRLVGETLPLPDRGIFAGAKTRAERVRRLAHALFDYFERFGGFERIRADQDNFRQVREFIEAEEARRLALAREALGAVDERTARVAAAVLDAAVHRSLRESGLTSAEAADEIAALILGRLEATGARARRRRERP